MVSLLPLLADTAKVHDTNPLVIIASAIHYMLSFSSNVRSAPAILEKKSNKEYCTISSLSLSRSSSIPFQSQMMPARRQVGAKAGMARTARSVCCAETEMKEEEGR
jgi:hypothetical protein